MPCGVCSCCEALENPQLSPLCLSPQVKGETERRTWLMRRWNMQRGRWMRSNTGNRVQHFNAYLTLFVSSLHALSAHQRHRRSVTVATYRWRSIHFENTLAFLGGCPSQSATDCMVVGMSCGERHPYLSLSQATEGKKKKSRFSMYVRCSREP